MDDSGLLGGADSAPEALIGKLVEELTKPPDREWQKKIEFWRTDPIAWFHDRLGVDPRTLRWSAFHGPYDEHTWDGDFDPFVKAAEALAEGLDVAIESGTGTGKTFFAAGITGWFMECWENSQVITIAPKGDQLKLHMWKELDQYVWPRLKPKYPNGTLTTLKLRFRGGIDETWTATGFPVAVRAGEDAATRAQGFHAEHMLFIMEEMPGILMPVARAVKNTCTAPHNLRLALGNPDSRQDTLHQMIEKEPSVIAIRVSALDHPNLVMDDAGVIPGAVSWKSVRDREQQFGKGSRFYNSRVRGISPDQASDALIRYEWIRAAQERWMDPAFRQGPPALGVDVANSENGDEGCIARGLGSTLLELLHGPCPDANILGDQARIIAEHEAILAKHIGVDTVGVGVGTFNELKRQGWNATPLNGGARAPIIAGQEKMANLRAAMYWKARDDLQHGRIALPPDCDELTNDLTIPTWTIRGGRVYIEAKEEIKKRLGRSPNFGDAFVYWNWVRDNPQVVTGQGSMLTF